MYPVALGIIQLFTIFFSSHLGSTFSCSLEVSCFGYLRFYEYFVFHLVLVCFLCYINLVLPWLTLLAFYLVFSAELVFLDIGCRRCIVDVAFLSSIITYDLNSYALLLGLRFCVLASHGVVLTLAVPLNILSKYN